MVEPTLRITAFLGFISGEIAISVVWLIESVPQLYTFGLFLTPRFRSLPEHRTPLRHSTTTSWLVLPKSLSGVTGSFVFRNEQQDSSQKHSCINYIYSSKNSDVHPLVRILEKINFLAIYLSILEV